MPHDFDIQKRPLPKMEDSKTWFYILIVIAIIIIIIIMLKL